MTTHRVYSIASGEQLPAAPVELSSEYSAELWRRRGVRLIPPGLFHWRLLAWGAFDLLRLFRGPDYGVLLFRWHSEVVHRSCVFPGYFSFEFMSPADLQIGLTFTAPHHRGRRLATAAIQEIVRRLARPGRRFWYLVEESNTASIRAAESAGLSPSGLARKKRRLGSSALGAYELYEQPPITPSEL